MNKKFTEKILLSQISNLVKNRLPNPSYRAFIFGSRATNTHPPFSDVDIGIAGPSPLPGHTLESLREDFDNSNIPYRVDIVDFQKVSPDFQKLALGHTLPL